MAAQGQVQFIVAQGLLEGGGVLVVAELACKFHLAVLAETRCSHRLVGTLAAWNHVPRVGVASGERLAIGRQAVDLDDDVGIHCAAPEEDNVKEVL